MAKRKTTSANRTDSGAATALDHFVIEKELCERLPYDRSTIYRKVKSGTFPPPILLSPGRKGWWWSVIVKWVAEQEQHPSKARSYFPKHRRRRSQEQPLDTTTA